MTKKLSLLTCGLIFTATSAVAGPKIEDAFAEGKASGDISIYTAKTKKEGTNKDEGFTAGSVGISYLTERYYNFRLKGSVRAAHEFSEVEEADYEAALTQDSVMNEVYVKYENEDLEFSVIAGRQEIDLEWLGDFNEAIIAEVGSVSNTTITAGFADRQALAAPDELTDFVDMSTSGIYFLDVKNTSIEGVELNPYYYNIKDLSKFYGLKATYSNDMFGILGHYATTKEDISGTQDGNIAQAEVSFAIADISFAAGYIKADKDGGIGSMGTYGDNIMPVDEGTQIYAADAKTVYASITAEVMEEVEVSAIYADTEYGAANAEESEFNLVVGAELVENLELEILYISVDAQNATDDWDKLSAAVSYSF